MPERSNADGVVSLAYKDILVHLDGTPEDEIRLAHAEWIASQSEGHLTGIFTNILPDYRAYPGELGAVAIVEFETEIREQGRRIQAKLAERFARLGVANTLRKIEAAAGLLWPKMATEARWADLFVATCPYGSDSSRRWDQGVESVLFGGGRSVYLVPEDIKPRDAVRTVLIGWTDSREAARAVAEAQPFLKKASRVEIIWVQTSKREDRSAEILSDIATHLHRHGANVTTSAVPAEGESPADVLLRAADRMSADLIVTGAYGHSRLREWLVGGMTFDLVTRSKLPLLMAH